MNGVIISPINTHTRAQKKTMMQLTSCASPAILASRVRSPSRWPPFLPVPSVLVPGLQDADEGFVAAGTGTDSPAPHRGTDGTGAFWVGGEGKM